MSAARVRLTELFDADYGAEEQEEFERQRSALNVARAVLNARLSVGWSQETLGKKAGTKQARVSELESVKGNPRLDTLDRVARELGLMVDLVPRKPVFVPTSSRVFSGVATEWPLWKKGRRVAMSISLTSATSACA